MQHSHYDRDTTIYTDGAPAYHYLKDRVHLINGVIDYKKSDHLMYWINIDIRYKKHFIKWQCIQQSRYGVCKSKITWNSHNGMRCISFQMKSLWLIMWLFIISKVCRIYSVRFAFLVLLLRFYQPVKIVFAAGKIHISIRLL